MLQSSIPEAIKTVECDDDTFYYVVLVNVRITYDLRFVIFETDTASVSLSRCDFHKLEVM